MSSWTSGLGQRAGRAAQQKLQVWRHESKHCRECGEEVSPFVSYCPCCGQRDPARVSLAAVVCLLMGVGILAMIGRAIVVLF